MNQNNRMTAVVCHGPRDCRVEQVVRPDPGPRETVNGYALDEWDEAIRVANSPGPAKVLLKPVA